MLTTEWLIGRREIVADHGIVAAKHPRAAEAGLRVLQAGGNAVDAAVTAAFAVGVAEPWMSGIGGGGFMTIHLVGTGEYPSFDYGREQWCFGLLPNRYERGLPSVAQHEILAAPVNLAAEQEDQESVLSKWDINFLH